MPDPPDKQRPSASDPQPLPAELMSELPDPLAVGAGTVLLLAGWCDPRAEHGSLELTLGPLRVPVEAQQMPAAGGRGPGGGWWHLLEIPAAVAPCEAELLLHARLDGRTLTTGLASVRLVVADPELTPEPISAVAVDGGPLIAICMATHEPDLGRLADQLDSIRAQDWPDWFCVISDDCSSPATYSGLEELIADDVRFLASRSEHRLGFYRNFERALAMAPVAASFVALSDQDDVWHPDKLSALHGCLGADGSNQLAYSDMRILDEQGRLLSDTYWILRGNRCDDIASMLVANTVTGAASLLRPELLGAALPFPPPIGQPYHDHWLALCALSVGEIGYLDRPTYDRVRHLDSVTADTRHARALRRMRDEAEEGGGGRGERASLRGLGRRLRAGLGGPAVYFGRYLQLVQFARVLELRLGSRIPERRLRQLRRLSAAERSWRAAAWLGLRSLRPLLGRDETMGRERVLFGAVLWRRLAAWRSRSGRGV